MSFRSTFHLHTNRCRHASGAPSDYCEAALTRGVAVLGFSDHVPYPDGRWQSVRMHVSERGAYVSDVRSAAAAYAGRLSVFLGFECEYDRTLRGYFRDEIRGACGADYLLGAAHSYRFGGAWRSSFSTRSLQPSQLHAYTDYVLEMIGSGLFDIIAHPDLIGFGVRGWSPDTAACMRAICVAASEAGVLLEINANGLFKPYIQDGSEVRKPYPMRLFWEIASEEGAGAVYGSDAHSPSAVWAHAGVCERLAASCGIRLQNERFARRLSEQRGAVRSEKESDLKENA